MNNKIDLLIIGPTPGKVNRSIGGATLLMSSLLSFAEDNLACSYSFFPLRKSWFRFGQLIDFPRVFISVVFTAHKYKRISIHSSLDFAFTVAPFLILYSSLIGVKVNYHFFGGNLYNRLHKLPKFYKGWLYRTLLSVSSIHLETKELVGNFKDRIPAKVFWLPNCRVRSAEIGVNNYEFRKKFVFMSRVIESKGILDILAVFSQLPHDYIIDIYGPIELPNFMTLIDGLKNVNYQGVVSPNKTLAVLSKYDVLLLPTYYGGEGYPGVIIESFSVGIPVISTKWKQIPELVVNNMNGFLIDIKRPDQLRKVILSINQKLYKKMKNNAIASFENFSIENVGKNWIEELFYE